MKNTKNHKIKLLQDFFGNGNKESLKEFMKPMYLSILIFRTNGDVMNLSRRLNPTLPEKYTNRDLDESELNDLISTGASRTIFLLPDNGRD